MVNAPAGDAVRVLYLARGDAALYEVVRSHVPDGIELVTLESDDPSEALRKIAECVAVVVATRKLDAALVDAAARLRLVLHQGVGYHDTVDTEALRRRGIALAVTPNGTPTTVAEHAVMLMLSASRLLAFADSELRQGRFHVNALRLESRTVADRTIGFIGMGRIGQATARRLRGWGARGIYVDPVALSAHEESALELVRVDLQTLLTSADIISLHVPLTASTRAMIDATAFARMKRGSVLVNTARGGIVDQQALVEALDSGQLGAAGLDVFEHEPIPADHPLLQFRNVVLTPHVAAATRDTFAAKMNGVFENVRRFLNDQPLNDRVL